MKKIEKDGWDTVADGFFSDLGPDTMYMVSEQEIVTIRNLQGTIRAHESTIRALRDTIDCLHESLQAERDKLKQDLELSQSLAKQIIAGLSKNS